MPAGFATTRSSYKCGRSPTAVEVVHGLGNKWGPGIKPQPLAHGSKD